MEFPLHPQIAALIRPKLNRRNPHELHWRREAPEWHGSIARTHGHLYEHLADHSCCLQCGAVPCPFDHEEHKRLKLADLEFVKELAKDRRELKERVSKLLDRLQQYERHESEWERQKKMMEGEIERLKMLNTDNLKKLQNYKKDQERLRILTKRLEDLEKENSALKEENKKFRQLIVRQGDQIQELENKNKDLILQSEESQVRIHRLRVQLDETHEELQSAKNTLARQEGHISELELEVIRITQELAQRTLDFRERDEANQKQIKDLQNVIIQLNLKIEAGDKDTEDLRNQIQQLLAEIERLKAKLSSDTRFRRFVNIKRECNDLKEQNVSLLVKVVEHEKVCPPIPFMKADGRILSAGPRRSPPSGKRPMSAVRTTLNRPKSARTLQALESSDSEG